MNYDEISIPPKIGRNLNKVLDRVINNDLYNVEHLNNSPTNFLEALADEDVNRPLLNCPDIDPDCNYFNDLTYNTTYSSLPPDSTQFTQSPSLSIMHLNCRSILNKLDEIKDLLTRLPVTVLALTETWLTDNEDDLINIPGYQFLSKPRYKCRGGGIAFLIKHETPFEVLGNLVETSAVSSFEGLFIRLPHKQGASIMGVIYRPPGQNLDDFTVEIDHILSKIMNKSKEVFLIGDFNSDLLKVNQHKPTEGLYNCMLAHHLLPIITKPTRITEYSSTLIDNIYTNAWQKLIESTIIITDISDHLPILAVMAQFQQEIVHSNKLLPRSFRKTTPETITAFHNSISKINWSPVLDACHNLDTNRAYDTFLHEYKQKYELAFPICQMKPSRRNSPKNPWMSQGLLRSCNKKSKLYQKFIKNPNIQNKKAFTSYRNKFKAVRIQAEKNYYAAEFCRQSNNLKGTWKILKELIGRSNEEDRDIKSLMINGQTSTDPIKIATEFNNYFTNIAHSLAINIPNSTSNIDKYMSPSKVDSFGLTEISNDELIQLSRTIHPSHAKGVDDIDPTIALTSLPNIIQPLTEIINCSFKTGLFPQALKIAKVVPIFKKGPRDEASNYRPISVLPFFSKLFEKAMHVRLNNYITKFNILFTSQHGFQSGHSTIMPLLSMQDKISAAMDKMNTP